ncbi:MAG: heavy-metal-associated domain-containing protein [Nitrospirota bacterium]
MKNIIIIGMLIILLLFSFARPVEAEVEHITIRVDGLACPFCAYGLEKKITKISGVMDYDVNMKEGKVFIGLKSDAHIEMSSLYKAVREAGFTLRNISLRARGKIEQSDKGLILVFGGNRERFLLFKKTSGRRLERKDIEDIKDLEEEVVIEGVVEEQRGLPIGLSVNTLERIE